MFRQGFKICGVETKHWESRSLGLSPVYLPFSLMTRGFPVSFSLSDFGRYPARPSLDSKSIHKHPTAKNDDKIAGAEKMLYIKTKMFKMSSKCASFHPTDECQHITYQIVWLGCWTVKTSHPPRGFVSNNGFPQEVNSPVCFQNALTRLFNHPYQLHTRCKKAHQSNTWC